LFRDLLKPFVGKLVIVEVEGYLLTGRLVCFSSKSNIFSENGRNLMMFRGTGATLVF